MASILSSGCKVKDVVATVRRLVEVTREVREVIQALKVGVARYRLGH